MARLRELEARRRGLTTPICVAACVFIVCVAVAAAASPVSAHVRGLEVTAIMYSGDNAQHGFQVGETVTVTTNAKYFEWVESEDGQWVESERAHITVIPRPITDDGRMLLRVTGPGGAEEEIPLERLGPHPHAEGTTQFRAEFVVDEPGTWRLQGIVFDRGEASAIEADISAAAPPSPWRSPGVMTAAGVLVVGLAAAGLWRWQRRRG